MSTCLQTCPHRQAEGKLPEQNAWGEEVVTVATLTLWNERQSSGGSQKPLHANFGNFQHPSTENHGTEAARDFRGLPHKCNNPTSCHITMAAEIHPVGSQSTALALTLSPLKPPMPVRNEERKCECASATCCTSLPMNPSCWAVPESRALGAESGLHYHTPGPEPKHASNAPVIHESTGRFDTETPALQDVKPLSIGWFPALPALRQLVADHVPVSDLAESQGNRLHSGDNASWSR